ncbi:hypothetical protein, partial [Desulfurobacterium sp.]|uniref:hypothetical protein n=1 Tax=Desulfurobacterium sp. TaxID=2004706 RepID=UPI0026269464
MKGKVIALGSVLLLTASCSTMQVKSSFQVEPLLTPSVKKVCFKNSFKQEEKIPPAFFKKRVFLRMYQPLKVAEVFRLVGVSAVSSTDKKVYIPAFKGTVKELVKIVEDKTGEKAFYTKDGIVFKEKYLASYPVFFPLDD